MDQGTASAAVREKAPEGFPDSSLRLADAGDPSPVTPLPAQRAVPAGVVAVDASSEAPDAVADTVPDAGPDALLPGLIGLRLALRARPTAMVLRLALAAAGAATAYLLLAALADAAQWSGRTAPPPIALARLAWCVLPLAAVALLAVSVVGTGTRWTAGPVFAVVGSGRARLPLLAAAEAALVLLPGSAAGCAVHVLTAGHGHRATPLPYAAVATLLAIVPLVCAGACAIALWPRVTGHSHPVAGSAAGLAAIACGLATALYAHGPAHAVHATVPMPGGLDRIAPTVLVGWGLVVAGPALLGPGLTHLAGRVLSCWRPGALRLLAGRTLQADARRIGHPLGALSAVVCAAVTALALREGGSRGPGPLTLIAVAVLVVCPALALLSGTIHSRRVRSDSAALLSTLGASPLLLRSGALLRTAALLLAFAPLTAAVCWLAVPLRG